MNKSLLDLYTDYLLSSFGATTATGLSRLLDGEISHDAVTRFLSEEVKTSANLWRVAKPLGRQIERSDGVMIIDDSIEEKPHTDENELICWHFDHSKNRQVKGLNFLTALYQAGSVSLPIAFDLVTKPLAYIDPKSGNLKRKSTLTQNERYRLLLRVAVPNQVKFRYVIKDSWYASADKMKYVQRDLKKEFVMPLKENRKVALSEAAKQQGQSQAVRTLSLPAGKPIQVWLEAVEFPLHLVKQLFTNEDSSVGILYLVTSDLTLSFDHSTTLYQRRWSVEVYHKSLKQNARLEKAPVRTPTTQRNQLFASLCAYIKLESWLIQTKLNHFALKSKSYMSALRSAYAELVKLNPQPLAA